jgi:hypothetical protein
VATVSFLAARAAPAGGFWIALAGGVALARVAQLRGLRQGFGASVAAMLETVAIMGPARFGVPFTQALTAPLLGRLEARSVRPPLQMLACGAIRLLHNTVATAFFIWIVTGGLDAYAGSYEALGGRIGLEITSTRALLITAASLLGWAVFASVVQVLVYRRGLRRWQEAAGGEGAPAPAAAGAGTAPEVSGGEHRRFDPRAVALAAAIAFALLLTSTSWPVLAIAAAWLALAWATARRRGGAARSRAGAEAVTLQTGLALAALLAAGAFAFSLGGGLGLDTALRRASRAGLLVLVATWLRAAAGSDGLREVSRRTLATLRRVPSLAEASRVLDEIGLEGRLLAAGRNLVSALGPIRRRPLPILDAVLSWVAAEAGRFRAGTPPPPPRLGLRRADAVLVAASATPFLALVAQLA